MSLIVSSDLIELTKLGLGKIYMNEVEAPPSLYSDIFEVADSKQAIEQELRMAGFGNIPQWNADGGAIQYDKPISGDRILFTHTDYALGWVVSHKMLRDDLYDKVGKELAVAAGIATRHSIEQDAFNIFNLGFTANGPDGVPLFSNNHPLLGGGKQDNLLPSAALTKSSLATALAMIKRSVNDRGQPIWYELDFILVPPELGYTAKELLTLATRVEQVTGTGLTAIPNIYQGVIPRVIECPYLTTTTGYFIGASKKQRYLKFWWRERPWYDADRDFDTKGVANSVAYAYSVGYSHYGGIWGSQGA